MSSTRLLADPTAAVATSDGGARQPGADLWCSYAAVRTLRRLGSGPEEPGWVADFLRSRQNPDGGFAWQRGLPSDVWASYYCAQSLTDLGEPCPNADGLGDWLETVRTPDGGFGMTPGQPADVWATYYACRLYAETLRRSVPRISALAGWLAALQVGRGGLAWSPGGSAADVRACYYGALAWAATGRGPLPWDREGLVGWLQQRQGADGGFGFADGHTACAWAAFRATGALRALGARPRDPGAAVNWLRARRLASGGYERWPGYGRADVWACFCVSGALAHLDEPLDPAAEAGTVDFVRGCQLAGTGFTYREPGAAGDSLATAASLLDVSAPDGSTRAARRNWLRQAQTPYEGGVMYMPGRGAEVRCTLWAASALQRDGSSLDTARLGRWLGGLQNVDGGVGYWIGRGSDLTSTASAVEIALVSGLDPATVLDAGRAIDFVERCRTGDRVAATPGAEPTLAATAQAARTLLALGERPAAAALAGAVDGFASPLGGWSARERAVPDLVSTYQAVLTAQVFGRAWSAASVRRLLDRLATGRGYAWSPLSRLSGGPLADCLGRLLARALDGALDGAVEGDTPLPRLNL